MKNGSRDLLVLTRNDGLEPFELAHEVEVLNELLYQTESLQNFCLANEVIDVNHFKIIRKPHLIRQVVREKLNKPFVFICNKN